MYDARSHKGGRSSNIFGLALGGVVAVGFLAVLAWPRGAPSAPQIADTPAAAATSVAAVSSSADQRMLAAVKILDESAYEELEKSALTTGGLGGDNLENTNIIAMKVLVDNADAIAKADTRHFDDLISRLRTGLKSAEKSGNRWCKGSFLASLEGKSELEIMALVTKDFNNNEAFNEWVIDTNAWMLEVVVDAKRNPVSHGKLKPSDQTALQGVVMSLMSEPKIMKLMMSSQGQDPKQVMKQLNICEMSALALTAVNTLPEGTKGRLWAETFKNMKDSGGDLSALQSMSGL